MKILTLRTLFIGLGSALLLPCFPPVALALEPIGMISGNDSQLGYAGVLLGATIPASSGAGASTALGAVLGTKLDYNLGVGLFASYTGQRTSGPFLGLPSDTEMSTTIVAAQGNYHLLAFHFGIELGAAIRSWSGVTSTFSGGTSTTTFLVGLNGGYDYKLSRNLSIGIDLHYWIPGGSTEMNSIQALGAAKLWL